MPLDNVFGRKN